MKDEGCHFDERNLRGEISRHDRKFLVGTNRLLEMTKARRVNHATHSPLP